MRVPSGTVRRGDLGFQLHGLASADLCRLKSLPTSVICLRSQWHKPSKRKAHNRLDRLGN